MKAALPEGIDGLFENVGGEPFQQAFWRLNNFAALAVCGAIASYEGAPTTIPNLGAFIVKRLKIQGFLVGDHFNLRPQAIAELAGHTAAQETDLARDDPRRPRKRAPGAGRAAAGARTSARCWSRSIRPSARRYRKRYPPQCPLRDWLF